MGVMRALFSPSWRTIGGMTRRGLRKHWRHMLGAVTILTLGYAIYALVCPIRLPRDGENEFSPFGVPKVLGNEVAEFSLYERDIRQKVLFAPPIPVTRRGVGRADVIEKLLKQVSLAGVTMVRQQPAAVIRVKEKSAVYKEGDQAEFFKISRILRDSVVIEIDGQDIELTR